MIIKDTDLRKPSFLLNDIPGMVRNGASIEIRCLQSAHRIKEGRWKGKWRVYAQYQGIEWYLAVQTRTKPKDHLSVDAVTSFADYVGISICSFPMYEGYSKVFKLEDFELSKASVSNPTSDV